MIGAVIRKPTLLTATPPCARVSFSKAFLPLGGVSLHAELHNVVNYRANTQLPGGLVVWQAKLNTAAQLTCSSLDLSFDAVTTHPPKSGLVRNAVLGSTLVELLIVVDAQRLKIILRDKSPDLFPHGDPINIGRSKMETYINTGVYDLFVDIVRVGEISGCTGHHAGHREIEFLGSKELPQRLRKRSPRRRMSGHIIGKVRSGG